jgi:hypothetical protein
VSHGLITNGAVVDCKGSKFCSELMRGWFPIFCVVEVGRLMEISMLVKKAPNRQS